MAKIKKFEDIESCKRARKLTKEVYTVTGTRKVFTRLWPQGSNTPRVGINSFKYSGRL